MLPASEEALVQVLNSNTDFSGRGVDVSELILFSHWLTMKCLAVAKMGQQCILNDSDLRQMNGQFEERSKNYRPVSLLSVVSKVFE